jgi:hypothetical protein
MYRASERPLLFLAALAAGLVLVLTPGVAGARQRRAVRDQRTTVRIARSHDTRAGALTVETPSEWSAPVLRNPTTITLSNTNRNLALPRTRDYILRCPRHQLSFTNALSVWGGHNVVLQDCDFNITTPDWAAHLKDQSGTMYVRNVHFGGARLTGGVQLQEPRSTVVMRDVLFGTVHGSYTTNHAECLQTWSGPARLLIDGLTCPTTYQGLFLLPNQWDSTTHETVWDLRNIDISAIGAYALWLGNVQPSNRGTIPVFHLQNVYVSGPNEPHNWDGTSDDGAAWTGVVHGRPSAGHFVRARAGGATGADAATAPASLAHER